MDDLISREAAIAQIKENYCNWCDHTDLCQSCETQDCIATIEQQLPAVDAIPVEWLREQCKTFDSMARGGHHSAWIIKALIIQWQEEQKAQK